MVDIGTNAPAGRGRQSLSLSLRQSRIRISAFGSGPTTMGGLECAAVDGRSAQTPVVHRRLGERVKSTLCCPSRLGLLPCRKREKAVLG
jgi:hypothetical protein